MKPYILPALLFLALVSAGIWTVNARHTTEKEELQRHAENVVEMHRYIKHFKYDRYGGRR
jgi:hypothetical protein